MLATTLDDLRTLAAHESTVRAAAEDTRAAEKVAEQIATIDGLVTAADVVAAHATSFFEGLGVQADVTVDPFSVRYPYRTLLGADAGNPAGLAWLANVAVAGHVFDARVSHRGVELSIDGPSFHADVHEDRRMVVVPRDVSDLVAAIDYINRGL